MMESLSRRIALGKSLRCSPLSLCVGLMVVRHIPAPQHTGEEVHCVCKRFCSHTQNPRPASELRAKINVIVKKMLQWYLATLCNLYSDQPKFSCVSGSNDSAGFGYLSVCIFLLVHCTALSIISSCVYSPFSWSIETTSTAHCLPCWLLCQKHGIEQ